MRRPKNKGRKQKKTAEKIFSSQFKKKKNEPGSPRDEHCPFKGRSLELLGYMDKRLSKPRSYTALVSRFLQNQARKPTVHMMPD